MKRRLLIPVFFAIMLFCLVSLSGCFSEQEYDFLQERSAISSIRIVKVIGLDEGDGLRPELEIICEVVEIDRFLEDFTEISCHMRLADPSRVRDNEAVIQIIYENADYEIIDYCGQSKYYNGWYHTYSGHQGFDKEQFANLLSKYIERAEILQA